MLRLVIDAPQRGEMLRKAFQGPRPGHKYISRTRKNGKWVYKYYRRKASAHGSEHVDQDHPHTLDLHADSEKFGHSPEQAYKTSAWAAKVVAHVQSGKVQVLKDPQGKPLFAIYPGKRARKYKFIIVNEQTNKRVTEFKTAEDLERWVSRNVQDPMPVQDLHGEVHHTLIPAQTKKTGAAARPAWMRAVFNADNPHSWFGEHQRTFHSRKEYEDWWLEQLQFQHGRKNISMVEVSADEQRLRPLTAALEMGLVPWKPKMVMTSYGGAKKHKRPEWAIDFDAENFGKFLDQTVQDRAGSEAGTEQRFRFQLLVEHLPWLTQVASRYMVPFQDEPQKRQNRLFEDMRQELMAGLFDAAKRYNPVKGWKFLTYANSWMEPLARRFVKKEMEFGEVRSGDPRLGAASLPLRIDNPEDAIDIQRAWYNKQEDAIDHAFRTSKDVPAQKQLIMAKFQEFDKLKHAAYDDIQQWVAQNADLPYVIPVDDPKEYLDDKQLEHYFGGGAPKVQQKKQWRAILDQHFGDLMRNDPGKAEYYARSKRMILEYIPSGDLTSPAKPAKELAESLNTPLSEVEEILWREMGGLAKNPRMADFLTRTSSRSKLNKALGALKNRAAAGVVVEAVKSFATQRLYNARN